MGGVSRAGSHVFAIAAFLQHFHSRLAGPDATAWIGPMLFA